MDDNACAVEKLRGVRDALFGLHKALIESERREYERVIGRIESPGEFVRLLMNDAWFSWLRPYSALIVEMDEAFEPDHEVTPDQVAGLVGNCRELLRVEDGGEGRGGHYHAALQRDPDVVLAHASVGKSLSTIF